MADIEQKIKLSFENNAEENAKDVNKLTASIDKTKDAQENTVKENSKVENSYKSLRVQLREATVEQQRLSAQYGSTSKEAIGATKAVAKLKDEMQFQKDLVKSYNPDEKFRGLTQTAGIAALALGGVSDGFKALGIESKGLDKVIGSAQAILGVTSAVAAMSDAYQILTVSKKAKAAADVVEATTTEAVTATTTQATGATWRWNTALLANPIVLITAGIVAAIAVVYAFVKITGDAATAEEKAKVASMQLSTAIDNQSKSFENQNGFLSKNNDHKLALLRASGASEIQIYKETKALADQELQLAKNYRAEALLLEQKAYETNRDNPTEFTAKALKDAKENIVKAEKAVSVGYDGLISLQQNHEVAVVQAQTDARNKAAEAAKAAREKAKADKKAELEKEYKEEQDLIRSQGEGARERYEAAEKLIADAKKANEDALKTENDIKVEKENADFELKKQSLIEKGLSTEEIEKEHKRNLADLNDEYFAGEADKAIKRQEDEAEIDKRILAQKQALHDAKRDLEENAFGFLKQIAGKNKVLQKGLIIAESALGIGRSIIAMNAANVATTAEGAALAIPTAGASVATAAGIVTANTISTGIGVAANIAATAKALSSLGGGSAPGGSQSSGGRGGQSQGASAAPQVNFQGSKENQIGNTIAGRLNEQAPIRVTVLENDITKVQANVQAKVVSNSF